MLPWMRNKQMKSAGISMAVRKPEGGITDQTPEESESYGLNHAAKELIAAIEAKDETRAAAALKAAFDHLNKAPAPETEQPEA